MSKIYKGWLDCAKSHSHYKAQKSMYPHRRVLLQTRTYFYLICVNYAFFIRVIQVIMQFCCQLQTFLTKHRYFYGSVMCYMMRPEIKALFLLEQSRACLGADISAIVV